MRFIDLETGRRFAGRLESEDDPNGFTREVLVIVSRGGREKRIGAYDDAQHTLCLLEGSLDDVARLDRAGFTIERAPEEVVRRRRRP